MSEPARAAAGWYPSAERQGEERFWDGSSWTDAFRPLPAVPPPASWRGSALSPAGKLIRLLALALLGAGLYVGFGMHVSSIGFTAVDPDNPTVEEMTNEKTVDCGTAFDRQFSSVACGHELQGRETTATILLIVGGVLLVGSWGMKERS